jgi:peptide/nickel transport system ATP-binding protein
MNREAVLRIQNLHIAFHTTRGKALAANNINLALTKGEKLGLVGESGCGKTTTILGIMRLIKYPGKIEQGHIYLDNTDLLGLTDKQMRLARFSKVSMIPQGAMNSLNPVKKIHTQITEIYHDHQQKSNDKKELRGKITDLLSYVGLHRGVANMYPHELSGGMKQRVCIAMAIALHPQLILADEPTSALDVVVQRQVMATLDKIQREMHTSIILIGHDMGLMAQFVDRLVVMYAGRIVEISPVKDLFATPLHPYTCFLIDSLPTLDEKKLFKKIPGVAPSLLDPPAGCPFHPRCPHAGDSKKCTSEIPELLDVGSERKVACHLVEVRA